MRVDLLPQIVLTALMFTSELPWVRGGGAAVPVSPAPAASGSPNPRPMCRTLNPRGQLRDGGRVEAAGGAGESGGLFPPPAPLSSEHMLTPSESPVGPCPCAPGEALTPWGCAASPELAPSPRPLASPPAVPLTAWLSGFSGGIRAGSCGKPLTRVQAGCVDDRVGTWPW